MCGIAGILNFTGRPVAVTQIKAMTDILSHRGPDGEGHYVDGALGLGHRRLAILDLSPAGKQPMSSENGRYVLTYNGEIYNFKELRTQLQALGHRFTSETDSEVVLKAYVEWGAACVSKFNGMFAFAVWDTREKELFIARDRYGIKPLYYRHHDQHFMFASEVKAFKESTYYHPEMDKEGLVEYLTFQNFFTSKTLFKDIQLLMPGHYALIKSSGQVTHTQYWDFDFSKKLKLSKQEVLAETDRLFQQAVSRQLVSDVPVNSYLSGGIDSGAITMIASKLMPHMRSFTVGFDLSSASGLELSFDERAKAEHISYLAGTEQYEMVLKAGDMERCMDDYVYHLEEPRVGQSYPNYYAAKLASKFGKVVLSGAGGDELFGGYPWRYFYSDSSVDFKDFIDEYYLKWQRLIPNSQIHQLLSPIKDDVKHVWTRDIFENVFKPLRKERFSPDEALNASLYLEAKTFLHGLLVVEDKLSMAHSLETRVPFLDNDLVDFAMQVPNKFKISGSVPPTNENDLVSKRQAHRSGKMILRETLKQHLDDEIVNTKKQGFSSPDASWFRGESIDFVKEKLKNSRLIKEGLFDESFLTTYIDEHLKGNKNHRLFIWSFLNLEQIMDSFFSKPRSKTVYKVKTLSSSEYPAYEKFLLSQQDSLFYHSIKYKDFLEDLLACESHYLIAYENEKIVAALPLMIKDGKAGKVVNSLPYYGSNGGLIVDSGHEKAAEILKSEMEKIECAAATFISSPLKNTIEVLSSEVTDKRYSQITPLLADEDPQAYLNKIIDSSARRNVKKAIKEGIVVAVENNDAALSFLEKTHIENMKVIGGKAKKPGFFTHLKAHFQPGEDYNIYVARHQGQPVSALLLFYFNKTVEYFTPVTVAEYRDKQPLALILNEAMCEAIKQGFHHFNWGGTWLSQTGVYQFKKKWGAVERTYTYSTVIHDPDFLSANFTDEYEGFYLYNFNQEVKACA